MTEERRGGGSQSQGKRTGGDISHVTCSVLVQGAGRPPPSVIQGVIVIVVVVATVTLLV